MPPTPQPTTPRPLIIVVWLSVPTSESGTATGPTVVLAEKHALGQHFQVHLMHDAHAGRHDAEIGERALAPPQELVPFAIPLELEVDVRLQRIGAAEVIHLDRVVDHQIDRDQGIDSLRVTSEPFHGGAHGGQIHDGRHTVKSCNTTRAGGNGISISAGPAADQLARCRTSSSRIT